MNNFFALTNHLADHGIKVIYNCKQGNTPLGELMRFQAGFHKRLEDECSHLQSGRANIVLDDFEKVAFHDLTPPYVPLGIWRFR